MAKHQTGACTWKCNQIAFDDRPLLYHTTQWVNECHLAASAILLSIRERQVKVYGISQKIPE